MSEALDHASGTALPLVLTDDASAERQIRGDLADVEKYGRLAAFAAVRIGLQIIWRRDNGEHGALTQFMGRFPESRSTLYNYVRITDRFLTDAGLRSKADHKLRDARAASALVGEQLELFADPTARLEGAVKKLAKWVGEQSLSELYRRIQSKGHAEVQSRGARGGTAKGDLVKSLGVEREAALAQLTKLQSMEASGAFRALHMPELVKWSETLRAMSRAAEAEIRARRAK